MKPSSKTASKYRDKGSDIRSNGGYIVAPPSTRDGKAYNVINNTKPIDIPDSLIKWLLEGRNEHDSTTRVSKS
ncbi:MAG: bifunctional DNA primase/polymerase, partial [Candidatus Fonsibacter sp.]